MTQAPSKLLTQLSKEQRKHYRNSYNEELILDIYNTICKLDPKNLMLLEFLTLIIERDFIRNSSKLIYFVELFEQFKNNNFQITEKAKSNGIENEGQKFGKKKFVRMLQEISKQLYPGIENAYQQIVYQKLTKIQTEQPKIKVDESLRKMLTKEAIYALNDFNNELETIYEIYMPENFNLGLNFKWEEIKILEKKIPITCLFRFLFETEVIPQLISPSQFLELLNKLKPPMLPNSGSSKEAMFYTTETMNIYLRDYVNQPKIKLLEGDLGMTFLEIQVFLMKLASEISKDTKGEVASNIRKLEAYLKLKVAFDESIPRSTRFMETVKQYLKKTAGKSQKIVVKKRESRKKIQDLYDLKDHELKQEANKNVFLNMCVQARDLQVIRKDLDSELGEVPPKKKIDKENNGYFDIQKKHIVIGQQLPKLPEKGKAMPQKDNKKKKEDILMGYKPQIEKVPEDSNIGHLVQRPKKIRLNSEFPIILNEIFYPSNLNNQLFISSKAEVYLQTSYINLGERRYEDAFAHYTKAKTNTESKSPVTQFFYDLHAAQIFESAGRDSVALSFYHKAKELLSVLNSIEGAARAQPYIGMGVCLYHMDEYQYAFRCFEKARTVYGLNLEVESIENAILQNNIGCCLMMLNRNQEAIKYFEVSHSIFDMKVGCFDERTLTVQQNFNKNRKAYLQLLPEFKTMWKIYVQKSATKLPAVKSATKGKK